MIKMDRLLIGTMLILLKRLMKKKPRSPTRFNVSTNPVRLNLRLNLTSRTNSLLVVSTVNITSLKFKNKTMEKQ